MSRTIRNIIIVIVVATILIICGAAAVGAYRRRVDDAYAALVARAESLGVPRTIAELDEMYPAPPPDENAAHRYDAITYKFAEILTEYPYSAVGPSVVLWESVQTAPLARPNILEREEAKRATELCRTVIPDIEAAAALPTFRPDVIDAAFIEGTRLLLAPKTIEETEREGYIDMMTTLVANGLDAAEEGDWDRHRDSVRAIAGITRHCIAIPNGVALLRAELGYSAAVFVIGDAVTRPEFPDAYLAEYADWLAEADSPAALDAALKTLFLHGMEMLDAPPPPDLTDAKPPFLYALFLNIVSGNVLAEERTRARTVAFYNHVLDAIERQSVEGGSSFIADSDTAGRLENETELPYLGFYQLTEEIAPRVAARLRVAKVVCAIERFRRISGALPRSLDDLVPDYLAAVPLDPFDGQAIHYIQAAPDYAVYSIGADRVDDHGELGSYLNGDISFDTAN